MSALLAQTRELRHLGRDGEAIRRHRALVAQPLDVAGLVGASAVAASATAAWWAFSGAIFGVWGRIMAALIPALGLESPALPLLKAGWIPAMKFGAAIPVVSTRLYPFGPITLHVPWPQVTAGPPSATVWWVTAAITGLGLLATRFASREQMPYVYLIRLALFIQVSALAYFKITARPFPYSLSGYLSDMLVTNFALISLTPIMFALFLYIFDFGLIKKLGLTALTMAHLTLLTPLQFLIQAYFIHHFSLLFLPAFYLLLGTPLNVMVFIAFYSWGMSWEERGERASTGAAP